MNRILNCTGYEVFDVNIVKAEGCYLYDDENRRYVDFESGVWSTALGHNHPDVNNVIVEQSGRISHLGYRYKNPVVEQAASKVLALTGFTDGSCTFLCSGSEAVEFGVQCIRSVNKKPLLLAMEGAYLSAYGSSGKRSPEEWHFFEWQRCTGCGECREECDYIRQIPFKNIGGFVFEPGNTSGLVKLPPKHLIKMLQRLTRKNNGIIMANEVTTGFGRTGEWFGYHHYDFDPDVVAIGKGIGNGYPVSVTVMKKEIAKMLESHGFHYAQSHQNDALGCAVASRVIDIMKREGLVERSRRIGGIFKDQLIWLCNRHHCIKEVRARGLMIALEFEKDIDISLLSSINRSLFEAGYLVGYIPRVNTFRFYPSLVIGEKDIASMIESLDIILNAFVH